jgi:DNA-binding beta-propeller fold protein YncE
LAVAERGLFVFLIFAGVVLPAFAVAEIFVVQSSQAVAIGGCFLTALILILFLVTEANGRVRYKPRRQVLLCMAAVFVLIGTGSLVLALTESPRPVAQGPLSKGNKIKVGWQPFRVAQAPNGVLWAGERNARIHSIDTSLRQPIGTTIRAGHVLHDLEFFSGLAFASVDRGKIVRINPDPTAKTLTTRKYGKAGGEIVSSGSSLFVNDRSRAIVFHFSFDLRLLKAILINANPKARATAIALSGDGFLWVADAGLNALYKVSLRTNKVVESKAIPPGPSALLVVNRTVLVAHPSLGFIEMRNAASAKLLPIRIRIDPGPVQLTSTSDLLVVCNSQTSKVSSISLETGKPVGQALAVGAMPTDLAFGPGDGKTGWIADSDGSGLTPVTLGSVAPTSPQRPRQRSP